MQERGGLDFKGAICAVHMRLCAARLVRGLLLRRALRLGPCSCAWVSGPRFLPLLLLRLRVLDVLVVLPVLSAPVFCNGPNRNTSP